MTPRIQIVFNDNYYFFVNFIITTWMSCTEKTKTKSQSSWCLTPFSLLNIILTPPPPSPSMLVIHHSFVKTSGGLAPSPHLTLPLYSHTSKIPFATRMFFNSFSKFQMHLLMTLNRHRTSAPPPLTPRHPFCVSVCRNRWYTQWASPRGDTQRTEVCLGRGRGQLLPHSPEPYTCLGLDKSPELKNWDGAVNLQPE